MRLPRLRSLLTPWSFMSSKVDAVRVRLDQVYSRLTGRLHTLQQAFPAIAMYFAEAAVDAFTYHGQPTMGDSEGDPDV